MADLQEVLFHRSAGACHRDVERFMKHPHFNVKCIGVVAGGVFPYCLNRGFARLEDFQDEGFSLMCRFLLRW